MKKIGFAGADVSALEEQLELAKKRLLTLCERELSSGTCKKVSVDRYNLARTELRKEFPIEVICMLDSSGFINEILCQEEKDFIRARKLNAKKRRYGVLDEADAEWLRDYEKKGGNS